MPTKPWRCGKKWHHYIEDAGVCCQDLEHATKNLTLNEHAHRSKVTQHRFQIHDLLSFWRKLTLSRFQRHDVKRHHLKGRWCGSNFKAMTWHSLEERQCSLDLQGTRRCPKEISDAKHTSDSWENVHRRWAMPCRLHLVFIFDYNDLWSSY